LAWQTKKSVLGCLAAGVAFVTAMCGSARADTFSFTVDDYVISSDTTTRGIGGVTQTDSTEYQQRYSLLFTKVISPNLVLNGGGQFEKDITDSKETGSPHSTNIATYVQPFFTLMYSDPTFTAGIGYYESSIGQKSTGTAGDTLVNRDWQGLFGWRPAGLPSIDLKLDKIDTYDVNRTGTDTSENEVTVNSHYGYKGLDLRYYGTYTDTTNKIGSTETTELNQNLRGAYSDSFLGGRLSFATSANIEEDRLNVSASVPGATVAVQVFPFAGLSTITDTPTLGALTTNPALIDGNLTVSAGINIGLPSPGSDLRPRNIGLDFLNPTEVNDLRVWVDRTLPPAVAASFSWDIYTSNDNLSWTFYTTATSATFGPFLNRFDIPFAAVNTRYIKVVVNPLNAAVSGASSFPTIAVTELQAFTTQTVTQATRQTLTSSTEMSNTSARFRIFNVPLLYYDFSYFYDKTSSGQVTETMSNGLELTQRLTSMLSTSAQVEREDGTQANEKRTAYVYNASLLATPYRTITNALVFSGTDATVGGHKNDTTSVFLNSSANVYKGFDLGMSAGRTAETENNGERFTSDTASLSANVVPYKNMTWSFLLGYTTEDETFPGQAPINQDLRRALVSLSYSPFTNLYLFGSLNATGQAGQRVDVLQNYSVNWTPFPDGALQFRFAYSETEDVQARTFERIVSPEVRYNINSWSSLDLSFQRIRQESPGEVTNSRSIILNWKVFL